MCWVSPNFIIHPDTAYCAMQVCQNLLTRGHSIVGSVAEIRQGRCHSDGTVNCLAIGKLPPACHMQKDVT